MGAKRKDQGKGKHGEVLIPDKLYFRIGEVGRLARLPAYVLRFWETEFPSLKPVKGSTGQRMFRQRDVELVLHIKNLLYQQGFTIAGAREQLKAESKPGKTQYALPLPPRPAADEIKRVRQGLREILALLRAPLPAKRSRAKTTRRSNAAAS